MSRKFTMGEKKTFEDRPPNAVTFKVDPSVHAGEKNGDGLTSDFVYTGYRYMKFGNKTQKRNLSHMENSSLGKWKDISEMEFRTMQYAYDHRHDTAPIFEQETVPQAVTDYRSLIKHRQDYENLAQGSENPNAPVFSPTLLRQVNFEKLCIDHLFAIWDSANDKYLAYDERKQSADDVRDPCFMGFYLRDSNDPDDVYVGRRKGQTNHQIWTEYFASVNASIAEEGRRRRQYATEENTNAKGVPAIRGSTGTGIPASEIEQLRLENEQLRQQLTTAPSYAIPIPAAPSIV